MSSVLGLGLGVGAGTALAAASVSAGAMADDAAMMAPATPDVTTDSGQLATSLLPLSSAAAMAARARLFSSAGGTSADPLLLARSGSLADIVAHLNAAGSFTPDEQLEIAKRLPEIVDELTKTSIQELQNIVDQGASHGLAVELTMWLEVQMETLHSLNRYLQRANGSADTRENLLILDILSSVSQCSMLLVSATSHISMKSEDLSDILQWLKIAQLGEVLLFERSRGYSVSLSKQELSTTFIYPLIHGASTTWEGDELVVFRNASYSFASYLGGRRGHAMSTASWPLDLEDVVIRTCLDLLGWKMTQTVVGDKVTLRINFGKLLFLIQRGTRSSLSKLSVAEEQMSALDRAYQTLTANLVAKISAGEEGPAIADWLEVLMVPFREGAEKLSLLNKELREDEKTKYHPLVRGLGRFVHEVFGRDLNVLSNSINGLRHQSEAFKAFLLRIFSQTSPKLSVLLKQAHLKFREEMTRQGVEFVVFVDDSMVLDPSVSLVLVKGVLENLFENASKYFDPKQLERWMSVEWDPESRILSYADNGIGMEPAFALQLGGAPLREGRAEGVKGTGTGWTIIANNLRELGWDWTVETSPGEGLKIRIQIPEEQLVSS